MNFTPLPFVILTTLLGLGILFSIAACSPTPTPTPITSSAISHSAASTLQALEDRGFTAGSGIISERSIPPGLPNLSLLFVLFFSLLMGIVFFSVLLCFKCCVNKYFKGNKGGK
jgi:4-hydroxybenzoate polyprenyltransferase